MVIIILLNILFVEPVVLLIGILIEKIGPLECVFIVVLLGQEMCQFARRLRSHYHWVTCTVGDMTDGDISLKLSSCFILVKYVFVVV